MARAGDARRVRAHRAATTARTRSRWRPRPAATATTGSSTAQKKWIGNGTLADVVVVWARDAADEQVKGFLVEKGTPGYDGTADRRQGVAAGGVAGRDHPRPTCGCPRRTGCPARTRSRTPAGCSPAPATRSPGRRSATPPPPTRSPSPTAQQRMQFGKPLVELPDRAGPAGQDARRDLLDAAVLPAPRPADRGRPADRHDRRAREDEQHPQGARRSSPRRATCSAATASCSTTT